jgi:hypothetical protein
MVVDSSQDWSQANKGSASLPASQIRMKRNCQTFATKTGTTQNFVITSVQCSLNRCNVLPDLQLSIASLHR